MSWALLLSKYPRSILTDEQPLLILTMLERAGLATESDLERMAGDDLPEIQKTLYVLQLNDLVEYANSYVRCTESGRELIERMSLHEQVMEDVLDTLGFRGRQRKDFKHVLTSYRKSSFRLYQNSLCTLREWFLLTEDSPDIASKKSLRQTQAGMRSLLIRDLRNWYMHSGVGSSLVESMNEPFRSIVLFDSSALDRHLRMQDETTSMMSLFLSTLVTENLDRKLEAASRLHDLGKWLPLFQDFHEFQASWEPDLWFDRWIVECKQVTARKHGSLDKYIGRLRSSVRQARNDEARESGDSPLAFFFDSWRPSPSNEPLTENFAAHLMIASSLSDLSQRTGIQEPSLVPLLDNVRQSCERLLQTHAVEPSEKSSRTITPAHESKQPS